MRTNRERTHGVTEAIGDSIGGTVGGGGIGESILISGTIAIGRIRGGGDGLHIGSGAVGGGRVYGTRGEFSGIGIATSIIKKQLEGCLDLFNIRYSLSIPGFSAGIIERDNGNGSEEANDGDNHQELDEGEGVGFTFRYLGSTPR